jgi:uncharacterized protein (TIGR02145 family)
MKKQNLIACNILFIALLFMACGNSNISQSKGTFTDPRDGKTYKTVIIGDQTWMAENLAYKANSDCRAYNDDTNNVATCGYLYDWETAKKVAPAGWHLPTKEEWEKLYKYLGGDKKVHNAIKKGGISGFNVLFCGVFTYGTFNYAGDCAAFWSSSVYDAADAWSFGCCVGGSTAALGHGSRSSDYLSVRLLRGN